MDSLLPSGSNNDATIGGADSDARPRHDRPLARGETVDRYVVLDKIGQGGMGVVYAAFDPELDRRVALKLLGPPTAGGSVDDIAQRARLLGEAQAMAKLAHPNVVPVHDAGTFAGSVFIAMELIDGGTLGARMAERAPWTAILSLFVQAGTGLAAAHAAGLVHRDFKPENVLVTREGVAKVSDFGLARAVAPSEVDTVADDIRSSAATSSSESTRTAMLVGTPAYMAPEQHLQLPTDARSDQFSFCVALYEALYGERPFRGRSLGELVYAVTRGEIAEPARGVAVPSWLRHVVVRGLAVDPADRWSSMDALLDALRVDPTRRRRRVFAALVGGVVIAGGLGGFVAADHYEREACRAEADAVNLLWGAVEQQRIAGALRASGAPYAEAAITSVAAWIDPWSTGWAELRESTCLAAARDEGDDAPALQRACLDERYAHLEVVLGILANADEDIARNAVQTVAGLPRIESCADIAWLRRTAHEGREDPQLALAVSRLNAFASAHRGDRARALADELLLSTSASPRLHARVLMITGQIDEQQSDAKLAETRFREAYYLAGRHRDDRTAALAAVQLTMLTGVYRGDLVLGRNWADNATMMVERDPSPELRLELLYAVGALDYSAERHDDAIAKFREQIELSRSVYGDEHPDVGHAHNALGNAFSSAGNFTAAEEHYEQARAIWQRSFGSQHPTVAAAIYNLGNLAHQRGQWPLAIDRHRAALAIRERVLAADHLDLAASTSAIGNLLGITKDHVGALDHHRRAHAIFEKLFGPDAPRVMNELTNLSRDLVDLGRFEEAEPLIERRCASSARVAETIPEAWVGCLEARANLAWSRERFAEAAQLYGDAVVAADRLYGARNVETATLQFWWGRSLVRAGDPKRGRQAIAEAIEIWRETRDDSHPDLREGLGRLGEADLALGEPALAVPSFERALELAIANGGSASEQAAWRLGLAEARRVATQ